ILLAVMLLQWAILDSLARSDHGAEAALYQSAALFAAGTVMLYAHTAKFSELGIALGGALFVVAIATALGKLNASGGNPDGVATRPSLPDSNVRAASFWLVALAPLALTPFLIPRLARQNGWLPPVVRALLILTPLAIGVALAAQSEKLPWEVEAEW